jgi:alkanesulfonate monooxygenase SsuD/methylene tetrahydromethanopterin reductase-like flavin-dependent oxidoreductase (luciferase family)
LAVPRFGVALIQRSVEEVRQLAVWAEEVGFDTVWVGDTLGDWIEPSAPFLDAWPVLGALAGQTSKARLGVLVTNVAWRSPVEIARWTMTLDQMSAGRFELGLGCGYVEDQQMAGPSVVAMAAAERVARLEEGLQVIDKLLRGETAAFAGRFTSYSVAAMAPGPVQLPRPPLTVAGVGERVMRLAARHADVWNTFVDTATLDEFHDVAARRVARMDQLCAEEGRDPQSLRRSLTAYFEAVDPWSDPATLPSMVETYGALGFDEFVLYPPEANGLAGAERILRDALTSTR